MTGKSEFPELGEDNTRRWDALAEWWDDKIGDGNSAQTVVEEVSERFLELQPGQQVLDIACGAGRFARRMAASGAIITCIDHSETFLNRARQRARSAPGNMTFLRVNTSDRDAMLALGKQKFDAAVCTFALMDMPEIEPLAATLPELLKPGARFVFSVTHPVFNSGDARMMAETELGGDPEVSIRITDYLTPRAAEGIGIYGQPVNQWYFHRPIDLLLNAFFNHGFVLDRLEERAIATGEPDPNGRPFSWMRFTKLPHQLVARLRQL